MIVLQAIFNSNYFITRCMSFLHLLTDKDECRTLESQCPSNSTCINTRGSYRCECGNGTTLKNNKCEGMIDSKKKTALLPTLICVLQEIVITIIPHLG